MSGARKSASKSWDFDVSSLDSWVDPTEASPVQQQGPAPTSSRQAVQIRSKVVDFDRHREKSPRVIRSRDTPQLPLPEPSRQSALKPHTTIADHAGNQPRRPRKIDEWGKEVAADKSSSNYTAPQQRAGGALSEIRGDVDVETLINVPGASRDTELALRKSAAQEDDSLTSRLSVLERQISREVRKREEAEALARQARIAREEAENAARVMAAQVEAERKARETAERQAFEEAARHGEERKARQAAERALCELQAKGPSSPAPADALSMGGKTQTAATGFDDSQSAARVFQNFGGTPMAVAEENSSDDSQPARRSLSETIMVGRGRNGQRQVEVVYGGLNGRATNRQSTSLSSPTKRPSILASGSARGELALSSGFRTNPENILASTEYAEQKRAEEALEKGLPVVELTYQKDTGADAERNQRVRERIVGDPLVREAVALITYYLHLDKKPELLEKVVETLDVLRRRLSQIDMKVMGIRATALNHQMA